MHCMQSLCFDSCKLAVMCCLFLSETRTKHKTTPLVCCWLCTVGAVLWCTFVGLPSHEYWEYSWECGPFVSVGWSECSLVCVGEVGTVWCTLLLTYRNVFLNQEQIMNNGICVGVRGAPTNDCICDFPNQGVTLVGAMYIYKTCVQWYYFCLRAGQTKLYC